MCEELFANTLCSEQLAWTAAEGLRGQSPRRPLRGRLEGLDGSLGSSVEAQQSNADKVEDVVSHAVREG